MFTQSFQEVSMQLARTTTYIALSLEADNAIVLYYYAGKPTKGLDVWNDSQELSVQQLQEFALTGKWTFKCANEAEKFEATPEELEHIQLITPLLITLQKKHAA